MAMAVGRRAGVVRMIRGASPPDQDAAPWCRRIARVSHNLDRSEAAGGERGSAAKVVLEFKTPIREFRMPKIPNAKVTGLRASRNLITVIRGPHIDKKSREQFDIQTRKWRVTMETEAHKLREKLDFLKQHRVLGVEVKATFNYMTRLPWPLQPAGLTDAEKWKLFKLRSEEASMYTPAKLAAEFNITEQQVCEVLRSMEERIKHRELFGANKHE